MSQSKKFWNKITILSFICSVMVIYTHAFNLETYGISRGIIYNIEKITNTFNTNAVPFFFAISGLLFFRNFQIKDLINKYKRRIRTILIPYVIWCIIYYLFYVTLTIVTRVIGVMGFVEVELSITELINWLWNKQYYTLWFLKNLIVFIAFAPVEYMILKNRNNIPIGVFSLIAMFFVVKIIDIKILDGFIFYLFGAYIGINHMDITEYNSRIISYISLIVAVIVGIIAVIKDGELLKIILIASIWYTLDLFNLEEINIPLWMKNTFFFYLCHDLILESLEGLFILIFGKQFQILSIIDYLFMPIITILIMVTIAKLAKKHIPKAWNIAVGGR